MIAALDRGRTAYTERRWSVALAELQEAEREGALDPQDLEREATAAFLVGRDSDGLDALMRAHEAFLAEGHITGAARCATWLGMHLGDQGEGARSAGWFARAERLLRGPGEAEVDDESALIPRALGALYSGDAETAGRLFDELAEFSQRAGDRDLFALAQLGQGQAQVMAGRVGDGVALFDEALVAVTAGEVSPIPSGIIYCTVIGYCQLAFDLRRAHEWADALDRWCAAQPDLAPFSGECQVHRSELYCLHGAWAEALGAARTAEERYRRGDPNAAWGAHYQQGEIQRLRGEFAEAEGSYRRAGERGFEPQPGLALLSLARGRSAAALSLIRGAMDGADPLTRRRMLPARVEIDLAAGDLDDARRSADELLELSEATPMPMLRAVARFADGAVLLQEGDAHAALAELRHASAEWRDLNVPYELARCRALIGRCHLSLADTASAEVEFEAARSIFSRLGAAPALDELDAEPRRAEVGPLTAREVEVLRLVASGRPNKVIAADLHLSEKTVARHLSNIFVKLGIGSRAAATAYAYENRLVQIG